MAATKPLTPPDFNQCQADVPTGHSFMTLGGRVGRVRCTNVPITIATEVQPGPDDQRGSMSLCAECWRALIRQMGAYHASFEPLPEKT